MLPVHVEQHTCFAGLVPWLLHQLSLAADQSRSGARILSMSWSQALNCLAVLILTFLHMFPNFLSFGRLIIYIQAELWPVICCHFGFFFLLS